MNEVHADRSVDVQAQRPQVVSDAHLVLVDIRRSDGRDLLVKVMGWGECVTPE